MRGPTSAAFCSSRFRSRGGAPTCSRQRERKTRGACVVALCNSVDSPLAQMAHHVIPLHAGAETSVAATKSYIASLSAIVHLVGTWTSDQALLSALLGAPKLLEEAWRSTGSALVGPRASVESVRGRPRFRSRHRARGGAEAQGDLRAACRGVQRGGGQHGPVALIGAGFPVLMFTQSTRAVPASCSWRPNSSAAAPTC